MSDQYADDDDDFLETEMLMSCIVTVKVLRAFRRGCIALCDFYQGEVLDAMAHFMDRTKGLGEWQQCPYVGRLTPDGAGWLCDIHYEQFWLCGHCGRRLVTSADQPDTGVCSAQCREAIEREEAELRDNMEPPHDLEDLYPEE